MHGLASQDSAAAAFSFSGPFPGHRLPEPRGAEDSAPGPASYAAARPLLLLPSVCWTPKDITQTRKAVVTEEWGTTRSPDATPA